MLGEVCLLGKIRRARETPTPPGGAGRQNILRPPTVAAGRVAEVDGRSMHLERRPARDDIESRGEDV